MKRILCIILAAVFMLTLFACAKTDTENTNNTNNTNNTDKKTSQTDNNKTTEEADDSETNPLDIIKDLGEKEFGKLLDNRSNVDVKVGKDSATFLLGTVQDFLKKGGKISYDEKEELQPYETSEKFDAEIKGAKYQIQITNITDKVIKVSEGVISRVIIKDDKTVLPGDVKVGSTKEEVEQQFKEPTYKTDSSYTYTITLKNVLDITTLKNVLPDVKDMNLVTITFVFENDVVKEIIITFLDRAYAGIEGNIAEPETIEPETVTPEKKQELVETKKSIIAQLKEAFDKEGLDVTIDEYTGEISFGEDKLLFENNESELTKESKEYIKKVAKVYTAVLLSKTISSKIDYIEFAGHASKVGTYDYNMKLSKKRAENVRKFFIESLKKNDQKKMESMSTYEGYSYTHPVFDKDGNIDIAASRRVAIRFFLKLV